MSFEHIVLGLLRTPAAGYELKNRFDTGVRHFWSAELAQIYPTLKRLTAKGLLEVEEAPSKRGPKQQVYQLTSAGLDELDRWLSAGAHLEKTRIALLAQLWFLGERNDPDTTWQVLQSALSSWREQCAGLKTLIDNWDAPPTDPADPFFNWYLTLSFGVESLSARIRWAESALQHWDKK